MLTTARLGLAHGTRQLLLAADTGVSLWIGDDVVAIPAAHGA